MEFRLVNRSLNILEITLAANIDNSHNSDCHLSLPGLIPQNTFVPISFCDLTAMSMPYIDNQVQLSDLLNALSKLSESNLAQQNRLSEALKIGGDCRSEPETLEYFLDGFVNMDLHITLLRKDIKQIEKEIVVTSADPAMDQRIENLTRDVNKMSEEFARLKSSFETALCKGCKI